MHRLKIKKNAFTLAETIIVCSIFAVMVVWIILWINKGFLFMNNTKVLVRATNFAREWVEMVYNIRDTNRRKYSWEKDKWRLYAWTGGSSNLLTWWIYIIKEWTTWASNDAYIYADYLTWNTGFYNEMDVFFDENNKAYKERSEIEFSWEYSYYSWGVIETWNLEDLLWWTGIEFYRLLRVYGVYKKNTIDSSEKVTDYTDLTPKEMRFCVKVFYEFNGWHHASELCSIMTNFME